MFHVANEKEIISGKVTDAYFSRTYQIVKSKKLDKKVRAEFIAKTFPHNWPWAVLAGIEECCEIFKNLNVEVRAMQEGTIFHAYEPVMEVEGMYLEFCVFETALLGLLCQASGVATKAARCKKIAGTRQLISFGGRRVHPAIAPMVERNAYIGGCDGVAVLKSAEIIDRPAMGTMPHALVLIAGDTVRAARLFHDVVPKDVKRVVLIDTFNDEKAESVRVAEAMGKHLYAVRLDTPGSRRGDFYQILKEVRWELDLRGFNNVKLFVSGGIDEDDIERLNPLVDGYGVGTCISNAPVVDFAMDIVEIDGRPVAKRGKMSGVKEVLRCNLCGRDEVIPLKKKLQTCSCGGRFKKLLSPLFKNKRMVAKVRSAKEIRSYVLNQLKTITVL